MKPNCAGVIPFNGNEILTSLGASKLAGHLPKALCIHLLIVLRSALKLPVLYVSAECWQRIAGLALNA